MAIRVVIVEDHALTRAGIRTALESAGLVVAGEAADGISGGTLVARERPDVALIDIGLPGRDGIALTQDLKREIPTVRIVMVTMHELDDEVLAALAAGADAYCVKSSDATIIIDAVRTVAAGGAYFDPRIAHIVLGRLTARRSIASPSPLTARESDVLTLVAQGCANAEIAERLHIGLGTVKGHIRDILEKLAASDRTHAAVIAFRRGLLS